jgi:transcriptional regulator with XRE-family HTH domain
MSRPAELPRFETIGERVRWWREHHKKSRKELAKLTKQSYSALADLENGRSHDSERLDLIALHLKVCPVYLRTDKGDPEAVMGTAVHSEYPASLSKVHDLDEIEQAYFDAQVKQALQNIENARTRKYKKHG